MTLSCCCEGTRAPTDPVLEPHTGITGMPTAHTDPFLARQDRQHTDYRLEHAVVEYSRENSNRMSTAVLIEGFFKEPVGGSTIITLLI